MPSGVIDDLYRYIGRRIKELRLLRQPKMSQHALAKEVGLSRVSIVNIERGRHRIQVHLLFEFARALNVSPQELMPEVSSTPSSLPQSFVQALKPKERAAVERLLTPKGGSDA